MFVAFSLAPAVLALPAAVVLISLLHEPVLVLLHTLNVPVLVLFPCLHKRSAISFLQSVVERYHDAVHLLQ